MTLLSHKDFFQPISGEASLWGPPEYQLIIASQMAEGTVIVLLSSSVPVSIGPGLIVEASVAN
jgi:hypothetical protein